MPSITDPNHHWFWQRNRSICAALWHWKSWWGPRAKRFTSAVTAALYFEVYTVGLQDQGLSCSGHLLIHLTIAIKNTFLNATSCLAIMTFWDFGRHCIRYLYWQHILSLVIVGVKHYLTTMDPPRWSNRINPEMSFIKLISQGLRSTKPRRWFLLPTNNLIWLRFQFPLPSVETGVRGKEERPPLVLVMLRSWGWEWMLITGLAESREWLKGRIDVGLAHWHLHCISE